MSLSTQVFQGILLLIIFFNGISYIPTHVPFLFQSFLPFLEDGLNGMDLPIMFP
jgi:hypothetical protein